MATQWVDIMVAVVDLPLEDRVATTIRLAIIMEAVIMVTQRLLHQKIGMAAMEGETALEVLVVPHRLKMDAVREKVRRVRFSLTHLPILDDGYEGQYDSRREHDGYYGW